MLQKLSNDDTDTDARSEEACSGLQILMLILILMLLCSSLDHYYHRFLSLSSFLRYHCHQAAFCRGCVRASNDVGFWWR